MKDEKPKKTQKHPTKGQLNKIIDNLVHPLFRKDKSLIFLDGVLHGLVEQNPQLSVEKFIKYNVPKLLIGKKSLQGMPRGKKRHYRCTLPIDHRFIFCENKKAGSWCLKAGFSRCKCPRLVISYK